MNDRDKTKREPSKREREIAFAPHQSPRRQADGDPGRNNNKKRPAQKHDEREAEDEESAAHSQADGYAR